jgi:hypothetical protein
MYRNQTFRYLRQTRQEIAMTPNLASTISTNRKTELTAACSLISVMLVYIVFGVAGFFAAHLL